MKNQSVILFFLLICGVLSAQDYTNNQEKYQATIARTNETIVIDGRLSEGVWKKASIATDFWQKTPEVKRHADGDLNQC